MIALAGMLLLGSLVVGRRALWAGWPGLAALAAVLAVRLWGVPALVRHQYDGHEADHLDFFLGAASPGAADTLRYPLMQGWWWLWGVVLPPEPVLPVIISAVVASLGVAALAGAVGLLAGRTAGWVALVVVGLHPEHAAWSSSAYNVGLPWSLAAAGLLGVAADRSWPADWWPRMLAVSALALSAVGRIEMLVIAAACGVLALAGPGGLRVQLLRWLPALASGWVLAAQGLVAVLGAGPLPGSEERVLSVANNLGILDYHAPYDHPVGLAVLVVALIGAGRRWPVLTVVMGGLVVGNHLLMTTFSDYGARHALPGLVGIAVVIGAAAAALPRALSGVIVLTAAGLSLHGLSDLRARYYADEEAFAAVLEAPPYETLPRLEQPPAEGCGWVAEDPRVAADPPRSHFNLLDPAEAEDLRGEGGCLRWCLDLQDWRWSSRAVRDRAIRLAHLYEVQSEAVVLERTSGYACLVMRIGERSTGASPLAEWHGRGHPADTRLP